VDSEPLVNWDVAWYTSVLTLALNSEQHIKETLPAYADQYRREGIVLTHLSEEMAANLNGRNLPVCIYLKYGQAPRNNILLLTKRTYTQQHRSHTTVYIICLGMQQAIPCSSV
jgi:hypothetical protein